MENLYSQPLHLTAQDWWESTGRTPTDSSPTNKLPLQPRNSSTVMYLGPKIYRPLGKIVQIKKLT